MRDTAEAPAVPVVDPNTVFTRATFTETFGLKGRSLQREIRLGPLRVAKRCGRLYVLGAWALEWLAAGALKRQKTPDA
jgi:hypothetical protein